MESHAHNIGKSEFYVKITDFMLSCIRQEHESGNDIASAIEDGKEKDFTADVPLMKAIKEPKQPCDKASAEAMAEHDDKIAQHDVR